MSHLNGNGTSAADLYNGMELSSNMIIAGVLVEGLMIL